MIAPADKLLIGFAGDVMLGRNVNEQIRNSDHSYAWGNVLPLLRSTDLNVINLECAITNHTKKAIKTFNFKTDPEHVGVLTTAKIDAVSLANNHVLDFGIPGLLDTLLLLTAAGIRYAGAGKNEAEASQAVILSRNKIRVALLAFTDNEPGWKAAKNSPGTNYLETGDIEPVRAAINNVKPQCDLIVVSLHWGPNMREAPTQDFIDFAHSIIDSGADIIHGHSAHIFQGIEWYRGKLIMYDTGDFVDDYRVDPVYRNDRSFLFLCEAGRHVIHLLRLVPVVISNMQVNLATGNEYEWLLKRIREISQQFGTVVSEHRREGIISHPPAA